MSMQDAKILEVYEAISSVAEEMLAAARQGNWELLIERERACRTLVDWLKEHANGVSLEPASQARRLEIVRKYLADDAQIRDLAAPQLAWLGAMLRGSRSERDVRTAYNASD